MRNPNSITALEIRLITQSLVVTWFGSGDRDGGGAGISPDGWYGYNIEDLTWSLVHSVIIAVMTQCVVQETFHSVQGYK